MTESRSRYEALVRALHEEDQRLLACRIARWALTEHRVEDPRLWEAVAVAERYAEGLATLEELRAARAAAEAAAWAAAWAADDSARSAGAAVWAAVWDAEPAACAAEDASRGAAWAAARAVSWSAAEGDDWAAARDAAMAAAYKMFFEWALELMIGEEVAV